MKQSKLNNNYNNSYRIWKKIMQFGEHTGCHQLPERSFFIHQYQFPICARCTGVIIGYIISFPCYYYLGFIYQLAFFGAFIMFLDWFLQFINIVPSTNLRRIITGILGGYGIMSIQLYIITQLLVVFL